MSIYCIKKLLEENFGYKVKLLAKGEKLNLRLERGMMRNNMNEIKINELITLKLEYDSTNIYVGDLDEKILV
ncbi:MAG: hypothetical protein ACFFE4_22010 [Candidatus Thorarchaeota archaeon]